ncbi:hypothetical protein LCY76_23650 [Fictibacillus sp. KIGAM418]|uniref:Uncharacterized protein n=1 Tax=Fictibacillus marinisediminis TaxID=2878389 RepID=A0A9X1XH22_9BACL|nr:hypothetical protein [Fictibacillus marinisediminis]MCK6259568.1 hypothetical protein [Fictibacillus marinisediminis]
MMEKLAGYRNQKSVVDTVFKRYLFVFIFIKKDGVRMGNLDKSFEQLKKEIRKDGTAIKKFKFEYISGESPFISFKGIQHMQMSNTYFETLEEHMEYAYYQWLQKFTDRFEAFTISADVNDEGEIEHEDLEVEIGINIPSKMQKNWVSFLDRPLRKLMVLSQNITGLQFVYRNYRMIQVIFKIKVGSTKLRKWGTDQKFNQTVYSHWVASLSDFMENNDLKNSLDTHNKYFSVSFYCPVLQGKLAQELMEMEVRHRFSEAWGN